VGYVEMEISYSNLGEYGMAAENFTKAYELLGRVSERERYFISATYYRVARRSTRYMSSAQADPRAGIPHGGAAVNYASLRQYEKALSEVLQT